MIRLALESCNQDYRMLYHSWGDTSGIVLSFCFEELMPTLLQKAWNRLPQGTRRSRPPRTDPAAEAEDVRPKCVPTVRIR